MTAPHSLLDETLDSLRDAHSWRALESGVPTGEGWVRFTDIAADDDVLRRWFGEFLAGEAKGRTDVAGSYLSSYLAGIVTEPVVDALIARRRAWSTDAGNLFVRRHELGWFDGLAVVGPAVHVLPDDPRADDPDARVVADLDALRDLVAGQIADLLAPVFAAVRGMAPFGVRGMWGSVADGIGAGTLWSVRARGGDALRDWEHACDLMDRLAARAPALKVRPAIERIEWDGGDARVTVKGTCCLYYKVHDGEADPRGEGYCVSCPKRPAEVRHARWAGYLSEPDPTD